MTSVPRGLIILSPDTIRHHLQYMPVALLHICSPSFHLFSSPPALHFPPLSPWSIASFLLFHSPISMPTTSTSHSRLCSTFLIFFFTSCISPLPLPVPPSLLLFLHTYKSHMEGLLLILTCWGLHLFCLSRDPTMQFPVPGTH